MNGWIHSLKVLLSDSNHGTSVHPRPLVAASPTAPASGWRGPMLCVAGHYGSCLAAEGVCWKSWSNIKENWLLQRTNWRTQCVFKVKTVSEFQFCLRQCYLYLTGFPTPDPFQTLKAFDHPWPQPGFALWSIVEFTESGSLRLECWVRFWKSFWRFLRILKSWKRW